MKALGNIYLLYLSPQCDAKLLVIQPLMSPHSHHILNILSTTCTFSVTSDLLPVEASTDPDTENPDTSVDCGLTSDLMTVLLKGSSV